MPSFLNKVFGGDDPAFSFFKPKSRPAHKPAHKITETVPTLSLQLPGPKEGSDPRELAIVFEADPDAQTLLDDVVIAAKRLSPLEALILVRLCVQAISERGLETIGVMHPHYFSASPHVQRKLISLFIRSLSPQNRPTTFSPTPASPTAAFENELHYTRSPHDVAAVLCWGLRHLDLENARFSKDVPEWAWYNLFFDAERNSSYPPRAFSNLVLPQLPVSHIELLTSILNLISSLAAHVERSGTSGSRICKFLGLWLLTATQSEQSDDWYQFYARWERAGRILEHLFLARLREESVTLRLPTRLQELVKHYPYKASFTSEDDLLPRPRFSTRQYDALLVRVETVLVQGAEQPKKHPIQLLLEAFQLPVENLAKDDHAAFWNALKAEVAEEESSSESDGLQFTRIFVDETIQLLALLPADNNVSSPVILSSPFVSRKRSSTPDKPSAPASPTSPSSPVITDWAQFSLSGFGDAPSTQPLVALLDPNEDAEGSQAQLSRKSSRHRRSRRRRSQESPVTPLHELEPIVETKLGSIHVVQIDEAFIDFWSDAIVDPVSSSWPTFVICGLKQIPSAEQPLRWLVIEQMYSRQEPARHPSPDGRRGRSPRPSFKSDMSGFRINSMFSSARKRLSVFSKSVTDLDPRRSGRKSPVSGELGKAPVEEEPTFSSAPSKTDLVDGNATVGSITSDAAADGIDPLNPNEISLAPINNGVALDPKEREVGLRSGPASHGVEQGVSCALGGVDTSDIAGKEPPTSGESANAAQIGSRLQDTQVAMPAATAAIEKSPEVITEKTRVAEQPSSASTCAATTVEHREMHPSMAIAAEAGAQLDPDSIRTMDTTTVEATQVADVPPQGSPGHAYQSCVGQVPADAAESEALVSLSHDTASPRLDENAGPQSVAAESSAESVVRIKANVQGDAEYTADHVPAATEEGEEAVDEEAVEADVERVVVGPEAGTDAQLCAAADSFGSGVSTPVPERPEIVRETPSPDNNNHHVDVIGGVCKAAPEAEEPNVLVDRVQGVGEHVVSDEATAQSANDDDDHGDDDHASAKQTRAEGATVRAQHDQGQEAVEEDDPRDAEPGPREDVQEKDVVGSAEAGASLDVGASEGQVDHVTITTAEQPVADAEAGSVEA